MLLITAEAALTLPFVGGSRLYTFDMAGAAAAAAVAAVAAPAGLLLQCFDAVYVAYVISPLAALVLAQALAVFWGWQVLLLISGLKRSYSLLRGAHQHA